MPSAIPLLAALLIAGCGTTGPDAIERQRGSYIQVLATTDKQELLANIVRLAYLDPPVFLQVASVTASPAVEYGLAANVSVGGADVDPPAAVLAPSVLYKDQPTIVYKPLQGREFSEELLVPFGIAPVFLMLDNGFDFAVVARLLFRSIGGVSNGREASVEERARFRELTEALGRMLRRGDLQVGTPPEGLRADDAALHARAAPGAFDTDDGRTVLALLGLDAPVEELVFRPGLRSHDNVVAVNPRSLLSVLSHMSGYVLVPPGHEEITWPSTARDEPGRLMRIHASTERPADGDPAVFYRGHWFYVRAGDLTSRNTLFLLRLLFNLQAQARSDGGVALTLPVR